MARGEDYVKMPELPCRIRLAACESLVRFRAHKNTGNRKVAGRRQRQGRSAGCHFIVCLRPVYCRETLQSRALALLFSFAHEGMMTRSSGDRQNCCRSLPTSHQPRCPLLRPEVPLVCPSAFPTTPIAQSSQQLTDLSPRLRPRRIYSRPAHRSEIMTSGWCDGWLGGSAVVLDQA